MLKLWITDDYKTRTNLRYVSADVCFDYEIDDYSFLESDFSKRLLYDCSGELEVISQTTFRRPNGMLISHREIGSGSKNVLCMKYLGNSYDIIYSMLWCGDNCNPYIAEVARESDVETFSARVYNPFTLVESPYEVKIMETGKIVTCGRDFLDEVISNELWDRL